jgi:hypothetical protein
MLVTSWASFIVVTMITRCSGLACDDVDGASGLADMITHSSRSELWDNEWMMLLNVGMKSQEILSFLERLRKLA